MQPAIRVCRAILALQVRKAIWALQVYKVLPVPPVHKATPAHRAGRRDQPVLTALRDPQAQQAPQEFRETRD